MPETVESILESYQQDAARAAEFGERTSTQTVNEALIEPKFSEQALALLNAARQANEETDPRYTNESPADENRQILALESLPDMPSYLNHYLGLVKDNDTYFKGNHEFDTNN